MSHAISAASSMSLGYMICNDINSPFKGDTLARSSVANGLQINRSTAYLKGQRFVSKPKILSGNKTSQKDIDALSYREGQGHHTICSRFSIQAADEVRQVVQYTQVMLHHNYITAHSQTVTRSHMLTAVVQKHPQRCSFLQRPNFLLWSEHIACPFATTQLLTDKNTMTD
jgi:hypothetical protein